MSVSLSTIVSNAKGEFSGGASLNIDWNGLLRRATEHLLKNINPDTAKVRRPVYGGITKEALIHYMPSDIAKPAALYMNDGVRGWDYQPPAHFFAKPESDKFTVSSLNGARFLVVRHSEAFGSELIDDMDDITGMTGTATPTVNKNNYLSGESAVQASFTDAGLTLIRSITAIDATDYLRGTVLIPIYIPTKSDIASIKLRLRTDAGNYYEVSSLNDDIDSFIIDGWNILRFEMDNKLTVGTPTDTNINSWLLTVTAETGKTVKCIIDRMTLQQNAPLWLEGYRSDIFIDGTTGAYKGICDYVKDSIAIDREVEDIFHYELCLLVDSARIKKSVDGAAKKKDLTEQLGRAYATYYSNHPSEELPLSYNILPEMNRSTPMPDSLV